MSPAKEQAITEAATRLSDAHYRFDSLQVSNVKFDPAERQQQEVQYQLARAELNEAWDEVDRVTSPNFQPE